MRRLILITALFFQTTSFTLLAQSEPSASTAKEIPVLQSLNSADTTGGNVQLRGDARINELVKRRASVSETASGIDGWRIQIYNSSGRVARDEANDERTRFLNKYPDLKAYLIYQPPYFKIRVGDYRSKQEAYKMYKQIVKQFPVSYLVPDNINLPDLNIYTQK